jgi:hypothetical protein
MPLPEQHASGIPGVDLPGITVPGLATNGYAEQVASMLPPGLNLNSLSGLLDQNFGGAPPGLGSGIPGVGRGPPLPMQVDAYVMERQRTRDYERPRPSDRWDRDRSRRDSPRR